MSRRNDGAPTEGDTSASSEAPRDEPAPAPSPSVSPRASRRSGPPPLSPLADESVGATEPVAPDPTKTKTRSAPANKSGEPEFEPRPYIFVIDGEEVMPETTSQARTPPYWLLVDHTFAVAYCVCSPKFKGTPALGISQLTWALELLKTVKSRRGNYHKDIKILMDAIEDRILDCYVAIGAKTDELKELEISISATRGKKEPQTAERKTRPKPSAPPQSPEQPASRTSSRQDAAGRADEDKKRQKAKQQPMSDADEREFADFESGLRESPDKQQPQQRTVNYDDAGRDNVSEYYENLRNSDERRVLSVTYDEVMSRAPAAHEIPQRAHGGKRRHKRSHEDGDPDSDEGGGANRLTEKKDSRPATTTMSRQNLLSFFASWRQEQVERLQVEMQRLSNIEEFMARIDENFDRVLDEDVAKRLQEFKQPGEKKRKPGSDSARFARTR